MKLRAAPLTLVLLSACNGGSTTYAGTKMSDYFNAIGVTRSTYANEDQAAVPDNMLLEKVEPVETVDGREIVVLEQRLDDDAETFLGGVKWSTSPGESTLIHGWAGRDGVYADFDPPIAITDDSGYMRTGDAVVTETGGTTYTVTFIDKQDCPVLWTPDPWEDCVHISIDDGGGAVSSADPATRPIFVGEYWLVTRFFIAWAHTAGFDAKWVLSDYDDPEDVQ